MTITAAELADLTFTSALNDSTDSSFTYTVNDAGTGVTSAVMNITVNAVNDIPVASDAAAGTTENTTLNSSVPVPTDVDGTINATGYVLVDDLNAGEGSLTFNNDGSYSFDPGSDFDDLAVAATRPVTFTYTASDNDGGVSVKKTITITVTGTNDIPVAGDVAIAAIEDGSAVTGNFTVTDADTTDTHTFAITSAPAEGSVVNNDNGTFTFNPGVDFQDLADGETRDVNFTYTARDDSSTGNDTSVFKTVTVTVTGTNDAPVITVEASDSAAKTLTETNAGLTVAGTLTLTDIDTTDIVTSTVLSVVESGDTSAIANATLLAMMGVTGDLTNAETTDTLDWTFNSGGEAFNYLDETQSLTLTYTIQVTDGSATDTQTVTITIDGTNDAPVIGGDSSGSVTEETTLTATGTLSVADSDDTDGVQAAAGLIGDNAHGTLDINAAGDWTYSLDNTDSAVQALANSETLTDTVTVTLGDGTTTQAITITIHGTNDAPVITVETGDSAAEILTETDAGLTVAGTLTLTDIDTTDIVNSIVLSVVETGDDGRNRGSD